jgi:8-oxo-dGTP pyrophosphatase MutT (NUDIX family)
LPDDHWPPAGSAPQCFNCLRLGSLTPHQGWVCTAFSLGIPKAIMINAADHRAPYDGDGGRRYAARTSVVMPRADAVGPIRAAGVMFVTPDRRILLLRRTAAGDHEGEWSVPGGKLEGEETAVEAAAREAEEETGRRVDPRDLSPWVRRRAAGVDFETFVHPVEDEFEPELCEEHDAHRWVGVSDLTKA